MDNYIAVDTQKTVAPFVQTGDDWRTQNHWHDWAKQTPALRAGLLKLGYITNIEDATLNGYTPGDPSVSWSVRAWLGENKPITSGCGMIEEAATIREMMGEACGILFVETVETSGYWTPLLQRRIFNRALIGISHDGSRAIIAKIKEQTCVPSSSSN